MQRFTRAWLRSGQRSLRTRSVPSARALLRSCAAPSPAVFSSAGVRASQTPLLCVRRFQTTTVSLHRAAPSPAVFSSAGVRASQTPLLCVRRFQTTTVSLHRAGDDSDKPTAAKPSDGSGSGSDSDVGDENEEDWEGLEEGEEEEEGDVEEEDDEEFDGEVDEEAVAAAAQYIGVVYSPNKVKKYSAELELDGIVISGGHYWTALDAAKGYDELVDLYCDLETPRNFPAGSEAAEAAAGATLASPEFASAGKGDAEWAIPEVGKRNADIIPPVVGEYLKIDEVLAALEREKAIDVYTVDLAGKSSLADYMIFTTGRSQAHMRRMADMMIQSMKARQIQDEFDYGVEGRDCDDWMIADCNNIVVHFMNAETRRILALEDHWENMVNDKHKVLGDMDEDEYMDKYGTSELMEYLEDDDFISIEDKARYEAEIAPENDRKPTSRGRDGGGARGGDIDWK